MAVFQPSFVISDDNTAISLKHVESILLSRNGEDEVIDVLKGDKVLLITTQSGKTYLISSQKQADVFSNIYQIPKELVDVRDAIFERWVSLNSGA